LELFFYRVYFCVTYLGFRVYFCVTYLGFRVYFCVTYAATEVFDSTRAGGSGPLINPAGALEVSERLWVRVAALAPNPAGRAWEAVGQGWLLGMAG
jgi:hypothetical protein